MKEVYPGIFMFTEQLSRADIRPPANIYIIAGENGLVYDAGYGTREGVAIFCSEFKKVVEHCKDNNIPCSINRILISHTHPDHFSGLKEIRNKLGLSVVLAKSMARNISSKKKYKQANRYKSLFQYRGRLKRFLSRFTNVMARVYVRKMFGVTFMPDPDIVIDDNCTIDIAGEQWSVFLSPGHCDDHISLYNPQTGVLFSGDNVMSHTTTWLGPPRSNLMDYSRSLKYMLTLPKLNLILAAHEKIVKDPVGRIKLILRWRKNRLKDVYRVIEQNGPAGTDQEYIVKKLYPHRGQAYRYIVIGWIELSLRYLMQHDYIGLRKSSKGSVFFPKKKFDPKLFTIK